MPSRGQSGIATVLDWNTSTNVYKTGDAANIELFFIKDGVVTTPANQAALTESSSASGGPIGAYSIAWTSAEGTCSTLWVGGQSSSANCAIIPVTITFENLPTLPTTILVAGSGVNLTQINGAVVVTSSAQLGVNLVTWQGASPAALSSTFVQSIVASGVSQSNVMLWEGIAPSALQNGLVQAAILSGSSNSNVTTWLGVTPNVLQSGLVQAAIVSGASNANVTAWLGVAPNTLISGRVDSSVGQVQANGIGPSAYVAGALGTTTFAAQFLTLALTDATYQNGLADALGNRSNAVETGITPYLSWRYTTAAAAGVLSGAGTTQVGIWGVNVTNTRISAVTDQSGNRQSVALT
jgi:hypothetical protein